MKEYTILEKIGIEGPEVTMVLTEDIYDFVHLCTAEDGTYILNKDGSLEITDEDYHYPSDYFDDREERLVIKVSDVAEYGYTEEEFAGCKHLTAYNNYGENIEVIDITSLRMSYTIGRAVDIEHGIDITTECFDVEDTDDLFWHSVEEVDAEWETEHEKDYPRQEHTRIATCDNGKKIRAIIPFFADELPVYEYVEDEN